MSLVVNNLTKKTTKSTTQLTHFKFQNYKAQRKTLMKAEENIDPCLE
jgi:hypothetical protein